MVADQKPPSLDEPPAPALAPEGRPAGGAVRSPPAPAAGLEEELFSDLPAPEEVVPSKPLVVRTSTVKLRLRPTPPRRKR
jgi:hypothetical protein